MQWASPALAVMGVAMLYFALRWSERLLQAFAWSYQALAACCSCRPCAWPWRLGH